MVNSSKDIAFSSLCRDFEISITQIGIGGYGKTLFLECQMF
jgi:hypothetical protein